MKNEFMIAIQECPTYVCNVCWKFEYRTNVILMNPDKYQPDIFSKCKTDLNCEDEQAFICKSCDRSLLKRKMPPQAQNNGLNLNTNFKEIEDLCPLELPLISQIIPFIIV